MEINAREARQRFSELLALAEQGETVIVTRLGVKSSQELAGILASVGLAQNFAALRALSTEGIQRGHMKLHAKNIAVTAGASGDLIEKIAGKMVEESKINVTRAKEILEELEKN